MFTAKRFDVSTTAEFDRAPRHRAALLALAAAVWIAGCSGDSSPLAPSPIAGPAPTVNVAPASNRVVIISIDGLRPDAILQTGAPSIMALAARGGYTWQARTIMPSTTLPSHVSMLSGYTPDVHRITWDEYRPGEGRITVPTLFTAAQARGLRTAMVAGKEKFAHFRDTGSCESWTLCTRGDADVSAQAAGQAFEGLDLLFVHLPDVDAAGHASGWMSEAYLSAVRKADQAVGRILSALPADVTVILTADHGGHGTGHGSDDAIDMTIPWIVAGPNTVKGQRLSSLVRTVDTAATAAHILGIGLSPGASGRPILGAFTQAPTAGADRDLRSATLFLPPVPLQGLTRP